VITRHDLRNWVHCPRRAHLSARQPELARAETPFERETARRRESHEAAALAALGVPVARPPSLERDLFRAADETRALLEARPRFLHRAVLLAADGSALAIPDLLVRTAAGYGVRFFEVSRRLERRQRELALELRLCCALLEEAGVAATGAEVLLGDGRLEPVELPTTDEWEAAAREVLLAKTASEWPRVAYAEARCAECPFLAACRARFEADRDPTLVPGIDAVAAVRLADAGLATIDAIAGADPAAVARVPGLGAERGREAAHRARALASGRAVLRERPELPMARTLVYLGLDGDPAERDPGPKEFLWGLLVESADAPPRYLPILAGHGAAGDRAAWGAFLATIEELLDDDADLRILHWSPGARLRIALYAERYGTDEARVARIERALFDLREALVRAVALPVTSYALRPVAAHAGFRWRLEASGGAWAVERWRAYARTRDEGARRDLETCNEDDLLAMRLVHRFLAEAAAGAL
jgi:uncharacterized protein